MRSRFRRLVPIPHHGGLSLVGAVLLLGAVAVGAQAPTSVTVSQRVRLEGTMTRPEAERAALEGAMAEAARRVTGVRVSGSETMVTADSAGTITSRYLASVRLDAVGHVVRWELVKGKWSSVKVRGGTDLFFDATYRMDVARDEGERDAGFRVNLSADRARYLVRGTTAENDEVVLRVSGTRDAHLMLVAITGDSVRLLAPNRVDRSPRVRAGQVAEWPSLDWRERGVHFRVGLPTGIAATTEVLAAVALMDEEAWPAPDGGVLGLGEFNRWLTAIPLNRRAVAQVAVRVERDAGR